MRGRLALVRAYAGSDTSIPAAELHLLPPLNDESLPSWVGAITVTAAAGEIAWARDAARDALLNPLSRRAQVAALHTLGWTSSPSASSTPANGRSSAPWSSVDNELTAGIPDVFGVFQETAAGYVAMIAAMRGDEATAAAILDRARAASGTETGLVNLELYACMIASMQGEAVAARAHASRMLRLAERLEYGVLARQDSHLRGLGQFRTRRPP